MDVLKKFSAMEFLFLVHEKCSAIDGCDEGCPWNDIEDSDMTDEQIADYLRRIYTGKFKEYAQGSSVTAFEFVKHFKRDGCYLGHHICDYDCDDGIKLICYFKRLIQAYKAYMGKDRTVCAYCATKHKFRYCPHCGLVVMDFDE